MNDHYSDFFNDEANDEYRGNYGNLLNQLALEPRNPNPRPQPELSMKIYNQVLQGRFNSFLLHVVEGQEQCGRIVLLTNITRYDAPLGNEPSTEWDGKLFATRGEVHFGQMRTVQWDERYFAPTPHVCIPNRETALQTFINDEGLMLLGPYKKSDDETTTIIRVRFAQYCPFQYAHYFLREPTPREALLHFLPQMDDDQEDETNSCQPFFDWLLASATVHVDGRGNHVGPVTVTRQVPTDIVNMEHDVIKHRINFVRRDLVKDADEHHDSNREIRTLWHKLIPGLAIALHIAFESGMNAAFQFLNNQQCSTQELLWRTVFFIIALVFGWLSMKWKFSRGKYSHYAVNIFIVPLWLFSVSNFPLLCWIAASNGGAVTDAIVRDLGLIRLVLFTFIQGLTAMEFFWDQFFSISGASNVANIYSGL